MIEGYEEWLCKLAICTKKFINSHSDCMLLALLKAMWAINDQPLHFNMRIHMDEQGLVVWNMEGTPLSPGSVFDYLDSNSKQETLQKTLEYIYKEEVKK